MKGSLGLGKAGAWAPDLRGLWGDLLVLGKVRIVTLVLVATGFGYWMAPAREAIGVVDPWTRFVVLMLGTLLVGGGGNALNQYLERDRDRLMARTRSRPLPAGRMSARTVLYGGILASATGMAVLTLGCGWLAGLISGTVVVTYVLCYTPLKSRSELNTLVGAVPGALPPVLGWAAATGSLERGAWALFLIMFIWQLPHFFSIAWLYRDDYASAGMPMLTVIDPQGDRMRRQLIVYGAVMVPVSLYPTVIGLAGPVYFFGALVLSGAYLAAGLVLALRPGERQARVLLRVSILYLPLLLGLMLADPGGA